MLNRIEVRRVRCLVWVCFVAATAFPACGGNVEPRSEAVSGGAGGSDASTEAMAPDTGTGGVVSDGGAGSIDSGQDDADADEQDADADEADADDADADDADAADADDADADDADDADADDAAQPYVCPTGEPVMVRLPQGYCIDSTEVTRGQYEAWLASNPSTAGQIAACAFNTTYVPKASCMATPGFSCQGSDCADYPQICIDWCDASAYCKSAGKRLCGQIGAIDQWLNACTAGGINTWPYGNSYDPAACNGADTSGDKPAKAGEFSSCQSTESGYAGVFDLSGNVNEWVDFCNGDSCLTRGGSLTDHQDYLSCDATGFTPRNLVGAVLGFRCCAP